MTATTATTVLVVDDDAPLRRTIVAFLEDSGYRVVQAGDGREGLEVFGRERPDLVLADLRMPVMDGMALVARIRTESPGTPVIVISGTDDDNARAAAIAQGANEYVLKPIRDLGRLEAIIARLIRSAQPAAGNG